MRPRISIRGCVRPLVSPSVGPLVGPSVHDAFVKIAENGVMQDGDASYVVYTALFYTCSKKLKKIDDLHQAKWIHFLLNLTTSDRRHLLDAS